MTLEHIDILRNAGVNMLSKAPYRLAVRQFVSRLRELERLSR